MSKANHALTTSERAAPTRRALLCTAPVALAAALPEIPLLGPLVSTSSQCSPEFREWYTLALTTDEVLAADNAWDRENPGSDIDEGPAADLYNAMKPLEEAIFARGNIDEIALVSLYWSDNDFGTDDYFALDSDPYLAEDFGRDDRASAHLIQAVARRAMQRFGIGGAHV